MFYLRSYSKNEEKIKWFLIDAKNLVLGRVASQIATILKGKNSPRYSPNFLSKNKVVVINCNDIVFTGNKKEQKRYLHHTGYMGGLKERSIREVTVKHPDFPLRKAVERMLTKNVQRRGMMRNLYIYKDSNHCHTGAVFENVDFKFNSLVRRENA